ncbi:unnamed protein product [Ambrosiozyma monospora]|nr:unnamed protein product [Ambrosiozyma monospora]
MQTQTSGYQTFPQSTSYSQPQSQAPSQPPLPRQASYGNSSFSTPPYQHVGSQSLYTAPPFQQRASYSSTISNSSSSAADGAGGVPPPLPSKPSVQRPSAGDIYSTPPVYDSSMYAQFGSQNNDPRQGQNQGYGGWKY